MHSLYFTVLTISSTSAVLAAVPNYGQCGGSSYTGDTACSAGSECKEFNPWYSQCVPGTESNTGDDSGAASSSASAVPAPSSAAPVPSGNASLPAAGTGVVATPTTMQTRVSDVAVSSVVVEPSTASSVAAAKPTTVNAAAGGANGTSCSINEAFKAKGKKYIGVAADRGTLSNEQNAQVIKDNFGQVTPENS